MNCQNLFCFEPKLGLMGLFPELGLSEVFRDQVFDCPSLYACQTILITRVCDSMS